MSAGASRNLVKLLFVELLMEPCDSVEASGFLLLYLCLKIAPEGFIGFLLAVPRNHP